MKKIFALTLLTVSLNVLATDFDKYCLSYLEGKISGQPEKPGILNGFNLSKDRIEVAGKMVDTINILPAQSDLSGNSKRKNTKEGEEVEIEIMKFKSNGKKVVDYTMIINRDRAGNLISISKKPNMLQDFKVRAETLYFKTQNNVCIPEKLVESNELKFNVSLCRALDKFWAENPAAKGCMDSRFDQKLATLIKGHLVQTSEENSVNMILKYKDESQNIAGLHRMNCKGQGVESIVKDDALWGDTSAKKVDAKASAKEE